MLMIMENSTDNKNITSYRFFMLLFQYISRGDTWPVPACFVDKTEGGGPKPAL